MQLHRREWSIWDILLMVKGVAIDPRKVEVMKIWTAPKNIKALRGF